MECSNVFESYSGRERQLNQSRASTRQEKENQCPRVGGSEQFKNCSSRIETTLVGNGMPANDHKKTIRHTSPVRRRDHDSLHAEIRGERLSEAAGHRRRSLANSNRVNPFE